MQKRSKFNLKEYIGSIVVFGFFSLVNIAVLIDLKYSFFIYLFILGLILGYYLLRATKFCKLWVLILTSFFWSSFLLIFLAGLIAIFSIPIREWVLYIPLLLLIPLLFNSPFKLDELKVKPERDGVILLFFSLVSLIAHVFSVKSSIAPMLHDPISHASWAREILDTGMVNYFYSPGLHILIAFGEMVDGIYVSKYLLVMTNMFNALTFVPVYLFVSNYFKDKKFAILAASLFLVGKYPSAFFWAMGKNALVVGIVLMFLLFFVATLKLPKLKKIIIINILIFVIVLTHYPIAFISLIGLFFITLYKDGFKRFLYNLPGLLFSIVWGITKMQYRISKLQQTRSPISAGKSLNLENILSLAKQMYNSLALQSFSFVFGNYLLVLGVLGLILITIVSVRKRKYRYFTLFLFANILSGYIIEFVKRLGFLHIVYSTQTLTLFIFIYIGAAFLTAKIIYPYLKKIVPGVKYAFYVSLILLVLVGSYKKYITYKEKQDAHDMVYPEDVEMFLWMEANLEEEAIVLNNAARWGGGRSHIVYSGDGGAWLPAFTEIDVAMPFTEFSLEKTHLKYDLYEKIKKGGYSCEDIDQLLEQNISYYYKSQVGIFSKPFIPRKDESNFRLVYSRGDAKLYEILPCD